MNTQLNDQYSNSQWLGRGPFENYADRNTAAFVGEYSQSVAAHFVPYAYPQENGYKTDVSWLSLTNNDKNGLEIVGHQDFSFGVSHYLLADLEPKWQQSSIAEDGYPTAPYMRRINQHIADLTPRKLVNLDLDFAQSGIGGDNSWGGRAHYKYALHQPVYQFGFTFKLVK
jgi:beta-galactosidase